MPHTKQPRVFVLDKRKRPIMPCTPRRARKLLDSGRAVVHRLAPFTIRLKDRVGGDVQPIRVCSDPGSKKTGIALVRETKVARVSAPNVDIVPTRIALFKMELEHRGDVISKKMKLRWGYRKSRRSRNLRHRAAKCRRKSARGWLAPSLKHRVETIVSWVTRLCRWAPVSNAAVETARFDAAKMQADPSKEVDYDHGSLFGCELREYVLSKWGHDCVYCDKTNCQLQMDHVRSRIGGGSDRQANRVPACTPCNKRKGAMPIELFLKNDPRRLEMIMSKIGASMRDAAAVNCTGKALHQSLVEMGLDVQQGTGGNTAWNRKRLGVHKTHANDAMCVGQTDGVDGHNDDHLIVRSVGRGTYQRTLVDCNGFPRGYRARPKHVHGFRSGDLIRAVGKSGLKNRGTHVGRVAIRARGQFVVTSRTSIVEVSHRWCVLLQKSDGYSYGDLMRAKKKARDP